MRIIIALVFLIFLITACSSNNGNEAIMKADYINEDAVATAKSDDIEMEEASALEYIEFTLDEEQILIDIGKIPILHEFLRIHQQPQKATQEMNIEKIELALQNIYTLSFSCNNERCSYILLHEDQKKRAALVADMAQLVGSYVSPDQSKVALQFNRHGEETIPLSDLVIFDINEWQSLSISREEMMPNIMNYKWPFLSVEWVNDESIAISIPDLIEPNKDSYDEWTITEGNNINTVIFQLETD